MVSNCQKVLPMHLPLILTSILIEKRALLSEKGLLSQTTKMVRPATSSYSKHNREDVGAAGLNSTKLKLCGRGEMFLRPRLLLIMLAVGGRGRSNHFCRL